MGYTQFAIRIQSSQDLAHWTEVIKKHNTSENIDEVGEELCIHPTF